MKLLAQLILDELVRNPRGTRLDRFRYFSATKIRRFLLRFADPMVQFRAAGIILEAPFSHDLAINASYHPYYNTNLSRIAQYVNSKYAELTAIDIGANIGDTVAYIRRTTEAPVLCLEGSPKFFPLLQRNIRSTKDAVAECVYVGSGTKELKAHVQIQGGTSRIEPADSAPASVATKALAEIVRDHPSFNHAKLIKIDTDGFDLPILRGSLDYLRINRPVLFFEYDPAYFLPLGEDGLSVFPDLHRIGYAWALIYDNLGELLLTTPLSEARVLEDIHRYFTGRNSSRYCDICVLAEEDLDLAMEIRLKEQAFFEHHRGTKPTRSPAS